MSAVPIENAFEKLNEADFFLGLLQILILEQKSLPTPPVLAIYPGGSAIYDDRFSVDDQIAYLLSAFSNACYSVIECVRRDKKFRNLAKIFCEEHPVFYASGPNGGIRTINTHFRTIKPIARTDISRESHDPLDDLPDEMFRSIDTSDSDFFSQIRKYYISDRNPQDSISLLCMGHHMDLTVFLNNCRDLKTTDV